MAYLLPLLARLQPTMHLGCQALIMVPTQALAVQIAAEIRWFFNVLCTGDQTWFNPQVPKDLGVELIITKAGLWDTVRKDCAIVVTTPSVIRDELEALADESRRFAETLFYFFGSNMSHIVLDEVDGLIKNKSFDGFEREQAGYRGNAAAVIEYIVECRRRFQNRPIQMIGVSATYFGGVVKRFFQDIQEMKYQKLKLRGRILPVRIVQTEEKVYRKSQSGKTIWSVKPPDSISHCAAVIDVQSDKHDDGHRERIKMLARILLNLKNRANVLVCLPTYHKMKMSTLEFILEECGIQNVKRYAANAVDFKVKYDSDELEGYSRKAKSLDVLMNRENWASSLEKERRHIFLAKSADIRGLDIQNITHVVTFGLDHSDVNSQYSHIAGRTGRMGRKGTVITIADKDEWDKVLPFVAHLNHCKIHEWNPENSEVNYDNAVKEYKNPIINEIDEPKEEPFKLLRNQQDQPDRIEEIMSAESQDAETISQEYAFSKPVMRPWRERAKTRQ